MNDDEWRDWLNKIEASASDSITGKRLREIASLSPKPESSTLNEHNR